MDGKEPRVIENSEGQRTTPSVVAWNANGERIVGILAKRQAATNPKNTLYAIKRLIGRKFKDNAIQACIPHVGYKIVPAKNGDAWVEADGRSISPSEVGSYILQELKSTAEKHLNAEVKSAVITVPAYFNDAQRQATKDAGTIAGLQVERIINEPTAAALSFGLSESKNARIAVYDLGGGTFDISILKIEEGVFEVLATNGDTFLGGEDFDNLLTKFIIDTYKETNGVDLSSDKIAVQRVREAAENAKIELSSNMKSVVNIPYITQGPSGPVHLKQEISREKYESMIAPLVERSLIPCQKCIEDSGYEKDRLSEVILVGGMTRTPLVVKKVEEFFDRRAFKGVNPDESVAMGAAIQGGILAGKCGGLVLLDVTPLSLGTSVVGDIFVRIIDRNTPIPAKAYKEFTTVQDGQTEIQFQVYQGEREIASQNKLLGELKLTGIIPAPRGVPKSRVTFEIDANGILHVLTEDMASGKSSNLQVKASSGLSQQEIDEMIMSAKIHAEKDKQKKERIAVVNDAELTIDKSFKNLKEYAQHTTEEGRKKLKDALNALQELLDEGDAPLQSIKEQLALVKKTEMDIFAEAYKNQKNDDEDEDNEDNDGDNDDILV